MLDAQESANQVGFSLPARPGYAPIIAPPPALQNLEPSWKNCHSQFAFDPPRSLVPASALVPSPTPANQAGPVLTPAMPSPSTEAPPAQTQLGKGPIAVDPSNSGNVPPDLPGTVDPPKNSGPATDGKQDNAPEPETSVADPPLQPDTEQNSPDSSAGPNLENSGSNDFIQPVPNPSILEIGRQTLTALPSGGFAVAGTTFRANGPAVTVQGVSVSLDSSQIIVGSETVLLPTGSANGVLTAAGQTFTPLSHGTILVNGNIISVNGPPTTASGTVMSLASSGLIVDSQTIAFPTSPPNFMATEIITFAGQTFTRLESGAVAFDGMTLVANGPAASFSGTVVSLASSSLVIGSQTFAFPTSAPSAVPNAVVIDGNTLTAGGLAVTISGTTLSLVFGSSGLYVAVHGSGASTFSVPMTAGEVTSLDAEGQLAIGGSSDIGGLGSVIMFGFGPADTASKESITGNGISTIPGNSSNATTGILGFAGEGSRCFNPHMMAVVELALCISLSCFL